MIFCSSWTSRLVDLLTAGFQHSTSMCLSPSIHTSMPTPPFLGHLQTEYTECIRTGKQELWRCFPLSWMLNLNVLCKFCHDPSKICGPATLFSNYPSFTSLLQCIIKDAVNWQNLATTISHNKHVNITYLSDSSKGTLVVYSSGAMTLSLIHWL